MGVFHSFEKNETATMIFLKTFSSFNVVSLENATLFLSCFWTGQAAISTVYLMVESPDGVGVSLTYNINTRGLRCACL